MIGAMREILPLFLLPLLCGCVGTLASTAANIVTLPVKAASVAVDAVTTSQSEADEKRGREMRKAEEKRAKEARKSAKRCREGKAELADNCRAAPPQIR